MFFHTVERPHGPIGTLAEEMARLRKNPFFDTPLIAKDRDHWLRFFAVSQIKRYGTPRDRERLAYRDFPEHGMTREQYAAYLESDLWRQIRARVHERDRRHCLRCRGRATEVHHLSYHPRVMRGKGDKMLVSLCRSCHEAVETQWRGKLIDPEQQRREISSRRFAPLGRRYPRLPPWAPSRAEPNPLPE